MRWRSSRPVSEWREGGAQVHGGGPILTVKWGRGGPQNFMTPELDSVTCCILSDGDVSLRSLASSVLSKSTHDSPDSTAILYNQYLCYNNIKHQISYSYIDHVLIPYLSRELHEALLLGAGRDRPQGRPQACMGPAGGIVGRNMYFRTVMYRSLSLDYQYQSTTFTDIMLKSTYYSRIKCSMLFWYLLCSKLCQHNPPRHTHQIAEQRLLE